MMKTRQTDKGLEITDDNGTTWIEDGIVDIFDDGVWVHYINNRTWYHSFQERLTEQEALKRLQESMRQTGKWSPFFKREDINFAESVCKKAINEGVVEECKHRNANSIEGDAGPLIFYINGFDYESHKRVIRFMLENNLVRKTKAGKLYNLSFKFDSQTRAGEYGEDFDGKLKLEHFVNLWTGEWLDSEKAKQIIEKTKNVVELNEIRSRIDRVTEEMVPEERIDFLLRFLCATAYDEVVYNELEQKEDINSRDFEKIWEFINNNWEYDGDNDNSQILFLYNVDAQEVYQIRYNASNRENSMEEALTLIESASNIEESEIRFIGITKLGNIVAGLNFNKGFLKARIIDVDDEAHELVSILGWKCDGCPYQNIHHIDIEQQ